VQAKEIQQQLCKEAVALVNTEPLSKSILEEQILSRESFAEILAVTLACQLAGEVTKRPELEALFQEAYKKCPTLLSDAIYDLEAVVERDPACKSYLEPLLFFKGFQAIQAYRVAHALWGEGRSFPAKMLQSIISRKFSVDIHPAAKIGHGILMDHATNVVIGETAKVGNDVSFLHGVTLGGTGNETGDRHPKIGDGVMLGAHAQLLGNIRIGKGAKIGAGAVVVDNVPPHTTFAGVPAVKVGHPSNDMPSLQMQQDFTRDAQ
jgi:serine O-acetyltransferase